MPQRDVIPSGLTPGAAVSAPLASGAVSKIGARTIRALAVLGVATALCGLGAANSQAQVPFGLYNTGVDSTGALLTAGTADTHYTLTLGGGGPTTGPFVTNLSDFPTPYWAPNGASAQWISPQAQYFPAPYGSDVNGGAYTFSTTFTLGAGDLSTAQISGSFLADNYVTSILINGIAAYTNGSTANQYSGPAVTFSLPSTAFIAGTNTVAFVVQNETRGPNDNPTGNPVGLQVEFTAVPEPSTWLMVAAGLGTLLVIQNRRARLRRA